MSRKTLFIGKLPGMTLEITLSVVDLHKKPFFPIDRLPFVFYIKYTLKNVIFFK